MREAEAEFIEQLAPAGCLIEHREDMRFPRNMFYNTGLHLTGVGKRERSRRLAETLRRRDKGSLCITPKAG